LLPDHLFDTVIELEKTQFHEPTVFGGFVGPGLVGLVSAGYMIEKLNLHEIAHVRSQHIPPVAVFVGAKLRHPFRVYSNEAGDVVVIICELPIDIEGLYEISTVLLDWIEQIHAREIVILDGVGVSGIPQEREAFGVANDTRMRELEQKGIRPIQTAMISGIGGSLLNQCLTRRISGVSLLSTASVDYPDPGAALSLIKSINQVYGLNIATADLEQSVERLNQRLGELAGEFKKVNDQLPEKRLYG
jgi:uncharacterized protein